MIGRKGMSPIIATILLIAFAVALGAMIMNWSSSLVAEGGRESSCQDTALTIRNPMCFEDNSIRVDVSYTGEQAIDSLLLRIESPDLNQDVKIPDSALEKGSVLTKNVPSIKPKDFAISLIPAIIFDEKPEACEISLFTTAELPDC